MVTGCVRELASGATRLRQATWGDRSLDLRYHEQSSLCPVLSRISFFGSFIGASGY